MDKDFPTEELEVKFLESSPQLLFKLVYATARLFRLATVYSQHILPEKRLIE